MTLSRASLFLLLATLCFLAAGCGVPMQAEVAATAEGRSGDDRQAARSAGHTASEALSFRAGPVDEVDAARTAVEFEPDGVEPEEEAVAAPMLEASTPEPPPATATPLPVPTATSTPVPQPVNFPAELLTALNEVRAGQGLNPLVRQESLARAAGGYARYMAEANFFGHYGPDGSSPESRLRAAGFFGLFRGEALAAGHATPADALAALLASPGHAAILLDPGAVAAGTGHFYAPGSMYGHYWVVVTGNP